MAPSARALQVGRKIYCVAIEVCIFQKEKIPHAFPNRPTEAGGGGYVCGLALGGVFRLYYVPR